MGACKTNRLLFKITEFWKSIMEFDLIKIKNKKYVN
jgi:hypothetical protein